VKCTRMVESVHSHLVAMNLKHLTKTLAFRLFILITSVQTVILLGLTFGVVQVQETHWKRYIVRDAIRVSELVVRSTRYSMLLNRKEDAYNIVASVSGEPGITGIRVYNKQGEAIFGAPDSSGGRRVDIKAEACVVCHKTGGLDDSPPAREEMYRIFAGPSGERVLGMITPIRNEPECSNAACHAHPESTTILGVLDVKMSLASMDLQLAESRTSLLTLSLIAVFLVGLVAGAFLWVFVRQPVRRLTKGMEMVAGGDLDHRLEAGGKDELGQLAQSFNMMAADIQTARREITAWSETLEQKVKEKTADLEMAHRQIVQVEKMASIGNLASSVAHEINNPLEGILTYAKLLSKRLGKLGLPKDTLLEYRQELALIADEAQRCGNIVKNLLVFARKEDMAVRMVRLGEILSRCEMLVHHHAKMNDISVETKCTDQDRLECDTDQMQQVLLALMVNSIEAMVPADDRMEGGLLSVTVVHEGVDGILEIRVADNGVGMTDEVKTHLFEPFFTTKEKGTGLGLSLAARVIERHGGRIAVSSKQGVGSTFEVCLPCSAPKDHNVCGGSDGC
ncbi:MAG: HAMP domain-containing histidine kinase, partial [Candidatus Hydrogenedentes bacterium]|nr:HAMP domain-containing histidine kinase [Candidatus Hydrogenedentota bacterium]